MRIFRSIFNTSTLKATAALALVFASTIFAGCATVEPWQRGQLANEAMAPEVSACHRFEHNNEVYREGAVGANGGKSGGGCGCT